MQDSRTTNSVQVLQNDGLIGEFIGIVAGDGYLYISKIYHYRIYLYFNITERVYVNELKQILFKLFGKMPMEFLRENRIILAFYSKVIFNLVLDHLTWFPETRKCHSVHLKSLEHSREFKIGFVRGSLDSDGYLSDKKISFATSSPYLAQNITQFLSDLDFEFSHSVYKEKRANRVDMHHINIMRKERERFLSLIKPRERKNLKSVDF